MTESSSLERQNILNNAPALRYVESYLGIPWRKPFGELRFTIKQVAEYFDVDTRTIERTLEQYGDEIKQNGYEIRTGKQLQEAKNTQLTDVDVGELNPRTPSLWVFSFRAFLNLGMLLTNSEKAKDLRATILNIVMDYINQRGWWSIKYINQNDDSFVLTYKDSLYYRKEFTSALSQYVIWWPNKYPYFTNLIYEAIFKEHASEYKALMKLGKNDNMRHTLYSEVLNLVSAFEHGFADELSREWPLDFLQAKELFDRYRTNPFMQPLVQNARILMASRDKALRDIIHETLQPYIQTLSPEQYDKFCREHAEIVGQKSQEFVSIMDANKDVLLRLKDK